jgi:hypothetical protein
MGAGPSSALAEPRPRIRVSRNIGARAIATDIDVRTKEVPS